MIPNIHMDEKLMFERARERQREIERQHLLSNLPKAHKGLMQWMMTILNSFIAAFGTRMKQLESSVECSVCGRM